MADILSEGATGQIEPVELCLKQLPPSQGRSAFIYAFCQMENIYSGDGDLMEQVHPGWKARQGSELEERLSLPSGSTTPEPIFAKPVQDWVYGDHTGNENNVPDSAPTGKARKKRKSEVEDKNIEPAAKQRKIGSTNRAARKPSQKGTRILDKTENDILLNRTAKLKPDAFDKENRSVRKSSRLASQGISPPMVGKSIK